MKFSQIAQNLSPHSMTSSARRTKSNLFLLFMFISILACLSFYCYLSIKTNDIEHIEYERYKPLSRRKPMLDHESIYSESGPSLIKLSNLMALCLVALRIAGEEIVNSSLILNGKLEHVFSKGQTLEGVDDVVTDVDLKSHQMIVNTIKDSYERLTIVSEEDNTKSPVRFGNDLLPMNRVEFARLLSRDLSELENTDVSKSETFLDQQKTVVWIDPLDATKEYSENLTDYVTLMACIVHKSNPVAGIIFKPFSNQTYWSLIDESTGKPHYSADLRKILSQNRKQKTREHVNIIVSRSHTGNIEDFVDKFLHQPVNITYAGGSGYKTIELIRGEADAYIHLTHIKKWDICAPNLILQSISVGNMTDLDGQKIDFDDPRTKVQTKGLIGSLDKNLHSYLVSSFLVAKKE